MNKNRKKKEQLKGAQKDQKQQQPIPNETKFKVRFSDKVEINEISCRKSTEDLSKDSLINTSPHSGGEEDEIDNFIILEKSK